MNDENLVPLQSLPPERRKEIARMGAQASIASKRRRKKLREELLLLLSEGDVQKEICTALLNSAKKGQASAFMAMMTAIGEHPSQKITVGVEEGSKITAEEARLLIQSKVYDLMGADEREAIRDTASIEARRLLIGHDLGMKEPGDNADE